MRCVNCDRPIVQEKADPPFHSESGEERCWPDRDEWAEGPAREEGQ